MPMKTNVHILPAKDQEELGTFFMVTTNPRAYESYVPHLQGFR